MKCKCILVKTKIVKCESIINQHGRAAKKVLNMSKQMPRLNMSLLYYKKKKKEQALSLLTCQM